MYFEGWAWGGRWWWEELTTAKGGGFTQLAGRPTWLGMFSFAMIGLPESVKVGEEKKGKELPS